MSQNTSVNAITIKTTAIDNSNYGNNKIMKSIFKEKGPSGKYSKTRNSQG
tara:strand:+ start:1716 stop:1865 length:150 start_codon:yes stop_codon:yes gene_type:complete